VFTVHHCFVTSEEILSVPYKVSVMSRWPKSRKKETELKVKSAGVVEFDKDDMGVDNPDRLLQSSNIDEIGVGEVVAG